jgi:membrane protein
VTPPRISVASSSTTQRIRAMLVGAWEAWFADRAASKGAALAFYTLFSMTPVLVLVIAIAGLFFGSETAQGELFSELQGLVGSTGAQAIQMLLAGARNPESGRLATLIASVLLLVGATSVFAELKASLDDIWHV